MINDNWKFKDCIDHTVKKNNREIGMILRVKILFSPGNYKKTYVRPNIENCIQMQNSVNTMLVDMLEGVQNMFFETNDEFA